MAQVTNTFSSFDTIGIRESLANICLLYTSDAADE